MYDMSTYLDTGTADYTTTELAVVPQNMMVEEGQKRQYIHEYDGGDLEVITTSRSFFIVRIQWDCLRESDSETILDFYHDSAKADGRKKSFYWQHPVDEKTYVARFGSDLTQISAAEKPNLKEIPEIILRIEGVKA